jgi:anti-sigma regulatory factor (Ser/Thr protein kinase)
MEARKPSADDHQRIRLELPRDAEWASLLRLTVAGLAVYFDLSTEFIDDLKLIATEAFGHAIAGSPGASRVMCTFDVSGSRIDIEVETDAPRLTTPREDMDVSLFVLRALVDEVNLGSAERYRLDLTKALD